MKIQQSSGRASPSFCERERCSRGEGGAKTQGCGRPSPLYIGPLGGGAPALEMGSPKGAAAKGGGVPPKASGAPPHPRVSTLGAGGGPRGPHQPTMGWFPSPL